MYTKLITLLIRLI